VFEDGEGNIWVGTHAGLQRLTPHKITPLTDLPIARATAATSDGSIWVGTTAGLIRIASGGRRFYQESQGLPGIVVLALTTDSQGDLWVATERALARFAGNRFTTVLEVPAERRIFSIALSDGSLWLRDVNRRLTRVTAEGASLEVDLPEAFRTNVVAVSADRQGRLWIGMSDGRLGLRLPGGVFRSYDARIGNIFAVFEDASGVMWFGGDGGLSRFAHGQLTTLNRLNGLPSGVNSIVEDEDGVLWVGLTSGIARLEKDEIMLAGRSAGHQIRYRLFNSADGAAGIPVAEGSRTAVRTRDGRLWFATSGGVTVVDPHSIGEPRGRVPVQIESVLAGAATFAPAANLELPRRTSHVQFAFTALTLTDSVRVQFQYRLEGLDDKWSDPGTSRQASYTNLAPGQYRFVVRGSNGDGLWSEPVASLNFVIPPMFYQTTWFYGLCVLAVSLLVYGAWWLHVRRVRGEFALVLAERIRMSRAIHDTLLQGLAALALQVDDLSHGLDAPAPTLKERILRLRHRVEDQIREARQSIWDLRSPVLESKPFPEVLRDAARRAIGGRPVSLEFTVRGTPQPCSPAVKEQLLHICQEAVTNAVQHGRPTEVKVDLEYGNHAVRVRVGDDGCGFVPTTGDGTGGHYGVVSMKERAAQVRGRLTIVSAAGRGTEVEAVVPPM
jgi:sugar lactone lactonase YvrE